MDNITIVNFTKYETVNVSGLWQYNYGQILRLQGLQLPTAVEIHFALQEKGGDSVTRVGMTKDGVTDVVIPDSMLENNDTNQDYNIYAFIYLTDETSGQTEYKIKMLVQSRPRPEAFDRPEDAELFREAIQAVNEFAERSESAAEESEKNAQQTAEDRETVKEMVTMVSDIKEQVQEVKEYKEQAQTAATNALLSENESAKAKEEAMKAQTGAESAEDAAEQHALEVAGDKAEVEQLAGQVRRDKTSVEQTVQSFGHTVQQAEQSIGNAGVQMVQKVTEEGAKQLKAVQDKGNEVLQSIPEDFPTQMETKLDKSGHSPDKYLGTDSEGNVVEKEGPSGGGSGTTDYNSLENKPHINGVELRGEKTLEELGIQEKGNYASKEEIPTSLPASDVYDWAKEPEKPAYTPEEVGALPKETKIPSKLSDMEADGTHRTVTDEEKDSWNAKSNFSGNYEDLQDKPLNFPPSNHKHTKEEITDFAHGHSWNEIEGKPVIPQVPDKLPNPHKLVMTGAVEAEYDGSGEVTIAIPDGSEGLEDKLDKNQGAENAGKALVIGEAGNVIPGEVKSGDGIAIVNTMSGDSLLVISDSAERPIKDIKIFGNTEQFTTTGKNLFDINKALDVRNYKKPVSGIPYIEIPVEIGKTYVFNRNLSNGFEDGLAQVGLRDTKDGSINQWIVSSLAPEVNNASVKITAISDNLYFCVNVESNQERLIKLFNECFKDAQFEEGTIATSYEPYTGGQPSPSPEYPQEIRSVGKYNEETGKYEVDVKVTGKNLFDVVSARNKDNYKMISGSNYTIKAIEYNVVPNTDYTLSVSKTVNAKINFNIANVNSRGSLVNTGIRTINSLDDGIIYVGFYGVGENDDIPDFEKEYFDIQLEVGRVRTDYEPYREPQTVTLSLDNVLRGTSDYKDVIQGNEIVRNICEPFELDLTNAKDGGYWKTDTIMFYVKVEKNTVPFVDSKSSIMCNLLPDCGGRNGNIYNIDYECLSANGNAIFFRIARNRLKDVSTTQKAKESLLEYMADKQMIVQYAVLESTTEPFPEDFKQALKNLSTYYPTTAISAGDGEMYGDVELTYIADTKNYIDQKFEQINKALVNTQAKLL